MKRCILVGGTGGLGSSIQKVLANDYIFEERYLSKDRPDVMDPRAYDDLSGTIDLAIYIAGINLVKPITEISHAELQNTFNVNILGAFNFVANVKKNLIDGRNPTFIFASSIMVGHPYPYRTAYASSKAAIEGLTRAVAVEFGEDGIAAVCLRLGHLSSLMKSTPPNSELLDKVKLHTPKKTLVSSEKVASSIIHIHECSDIYNGQIIDMECGYTINRWPIR